MSYRPFATTRVYTWIDSDGSRSPGVAIMHGQKILAHMTTDEARAMADKFHDLADKLESESEDDAGA